MNSIRRFGAALAAGGPEVLLDAAGLGGGGAIAYGAWQIYAPAGWIAGGVLAVGAALLIARARG